MRDSPCCRCSRPDDISFSYFLLKYFYRDKRNVDIELLTFNGQIQWAGGDKHNKQPMALNTIQKEIAECLVLFRARVNMHAPYFAEGAHLCLFRLC